MPEFLTEKNFLEDFISNKKWIFGIRDDSSASSNKEILTSLIDLAHCNKKNLYNNIEFMTTKEAEMVKMFRNVFLATKVSICNEFAQYCKAKDKNYENVRLVAIGAHPSGRIGENPNDTPNNLMPILFESSYQ